MFFAYVIKNDKNKIYIGHTSDLEQRLDRHNGLLKNRAKPYTNKNYFGGWNVIYKEKFETRKEATIREKQLKSYQGRLFIKNLIK